MAFKIRRCFFLVFKLTVIKGMIEATFFEKLIVRPLLNDVSVLHHKDHVGLLDGGKTVRDNKGCASLHHFREGTLNAHLGSGINGRGCLVKNEKRRQAEHNTRDAK